jgi:hypothetical protein
MSLALLVALAGVAALLRWRVGRRRRRPAPIVGTIFEEAVDATVETWGCGYLAPTARMQYTGRSFSEMMSEHLLPPALRVRVAAHPPEALFPAPGNIHSEVTDPVLRLAYEPFFAAWARRFARLRWLQQGILHVYLLYVLAAVLVALAWTSARRWWGA